MRRWWVRLLAVVAVLLVVLIAAFTYSPTRTGAESRSVAGSWRCCRTKPRIVHVGKATGNLLEGFTAHDVVITDSGESPVRQG